MSFSRNIWWNLAYPLTVNRIRLSAPLTVICWHLRLGRRLGAFQIHTIRWRHSRLAPLTVTVTVSVAFRNVSIINSNFLIDIGWSLSWLGHLMMLFPMLLHRHKQRIIIRYQNTHCHMCPKMFGLSPGVTHSTLRSPNRVFVSVKMPTLF